MEASLVWKKLLIEGKKITTTKEITALASEIDRDEKRSLYYLQEEGYIIRILRGIFYVRSIEERDRGGQDCSIYEMVAMALKVKGVNNWYLALETALKRNLMTHEYYYIDYVITDSYRTTKVISIAGQNFRFIKRGSKHFKEGIVRQKKIRYSDKEKTVLDIAYRDYLKSREPNQYLGSVREYLDRIDRNRARKYILIYPQEFRENVEELI